MKRFGIVPSTIEKGKIGGKREKKKISKESEEMELKRKERIARFGANQYNEALKFTKMAKRRKYKDERGVD